MERIRRQGKWSVESEHAGQYAASNNSVDLLLRKEGKLTLVQCKRWKSQRVDVKVVREMFGLLAHHRASAIKIVAVGAYTPDAQRFAEGKPIELVTGAALVELVHSVQTAATKPAPQAPPQAQASASAGSSPSCPKCGKEMMQRTNKRTNDRFWGCTSYPSCRGTRHLEDGAL